MFEISEYNKNTLEYVIKELPEMIVTQVELIIFSLFLAIIIGIPLGILANKTKWGRKLIIPITNLIQTIPSLALFSLLVPIAFFGVGLKNAVFVLFLYALMPIVYNTFLGLDNIDDTVLDASEGIGLSKSKTLINIELPLALPLIMSGIRLSAVMNVATSIIAAKVGAGGLGVLIFDGIDEQSYIKLVIGSIVSILLAFSIDKLFAFFERSLSPRAKKQKRKLAGTIAALVLIIPSVFLTYDMTVNTPDITIWSSGFTEQDIMAEIIKSLIEEDTDYVAEINELGSSNLLHTETTQSDEPALYTTYTGTLYQEVLKHDERLKSDEIYNIVKSDLNDQNVYLSEPIGFNNTYTISMPREIAEQYNIETISDLQKYPNEFTITGTLASLERDDGLKGAIEFYDLEFKEEIPLDVGLRYAAIENGEAQAVDAFGTDSQIVELDLVVLEDDQEFFLPYDSVYVYNEHFNELEGVDIVIDEVADLITNEEMQEMNYQVNVLGKNPEQVADEFLRAKKMIE